MYATLLNETQFYIADRLNLKKYTMAFLMSPLTGILSSTTGLLFNKTRDWAAKKLHENGDVTDEAICSLIVREVNDIKTKIDGLLHKDLNSGCDSLEEGINFLNTAIAESNFEKKALLNETQHDGGKTTMTMSNTVGSDVLFNKCLKLSDVVAKIKVDSGKNFQSAKERFKRAREKAADALGIYTLSIEDKIFATKLRIVSEILECLDSPETVFTGCLPVLEKLHNLFAIQKIFTVYLKGGFWSIWQREKRSECVKSVMMINYVVFQHGLKFNDENPALRWPTIKLSDRSFYPISQWKLINMGNELDQHPGRIAVDEEMSPCDAVVNSQSEVIVAVYPNSIKIISRTGKSKMVELPDPTKFGKVRDQSVEQLAVDKNDKVYVVRKLTTQTEHGCVRSYVLSPLSEKYDVIDTHLLDFLKVMSEEIKMVINKDNDIIITHIASDYVYICNDVGIVQREIETTTFKSRPILAVSNKNEMITSHYARQDITIYTESGPVSIKLPTNHKVFCVAFHHVMCKIIVLTWKDDDNSYFMLIYSESGELETTISPDQYSRFYPAITSHPSGPTVVVMNKSITFI